MKSAQKDETDENEPTNHDESFPDHIYAEVIYNENGNQYDHLRFSNKSNGNSKNNPLNINYNQIHQEITKYHQLNIIRKKNLENLNS